MQQDACGLAVGREYYVPGKIHRINCFLFFTCINQPFILDPNFDTTMRDVISSLVEDNAVNSVAAPRLQHQKVPICLPILFQPLYD